MNLFQHEQISRLNESELIVYNYVFSHLDEIAEMNIRELAAAAGVSTSSVMRFCNKTGCTGYTEFKYWLRQSLEQQPQANVYMHSAIPTIHYLQQMSSNPDFSRKLSEAAGLCLQAQQILFLGIGTSGILGQYGARFFSSVGLTAFSVMDPFYPSPARDMSNTLLVALSVSGETPEMIRLLDGYKKKQVTIISLTNTSQSTIARMSDLNFPYYMPLVYAFPKLGGVNLTTQIPAIYILESLTYRIRSEKENARLESKKMPKE